MVYCEPALMVVACCDASSNVNTMRPSPGRWMTADLMSGQYANPVTVVAFNMAERWANDVSEDIAREIQMRTELADTDLSSNLEDFVEQHAGRQEPQLTLTKRLSGPLPLRNNVFSGRLSQ